MPWQSVLIFNRLSWFPHQFHVNHAVPASCPQVIFTYDVNFKASEIRWASRWDTYLLATDDQVHWFSIINSLMIVLFLR